MFLSKQTHMFNYFICYHLESGCRVTRPNQGLFLRKGKSLGMRLLVYARIRIRAHKIRYKVHACRMRRNFDLKQTLSYYFLLITFTVCTELSRFADAMNSRPLVKGFVENKPSRITTDIDGENAAIIKSRQSRGNGFEEIHELIMCGENAILRNVLDGVAFKQSKDVYGKSLLHVAASHGCLESLQIMCEYCNVETVNIRDRFGFSALHYAVQSANTYCVKVLLEHGANINVKVCNGNTPLHFAALHCYPEIVILLCKFGADVRARNAAGETPLVVASRSTSKIRERLGIHVRTLALLLKYGSDPNAKDRYAFTALHHVVSSCDKDCVLLLALAGGDTLTLNCDGKSCVQLARKRWDIYEVFRNFSRSPPTLEQRCLLEIRKALRNNNSQFLNSVESLLLPSVLKDKLLFNVSVKMLP